LRKAGLGGAANSDWRLDQDGVRAAKEWVVVPETGRGICLTTIEHVLSLI